MRSSRLLALALLAFAPAALPLRASATDCDHNAWDDADDIAMGRQADCDADGVPDACEVFPLAYAEAGRTPVGAYPFGVRAGDLDGDGVGDLVVALSEGALPVVVLRGDGAGGFLPSRAFAGPYGPQGMALADLDGDGRPEALISSYDGLSVFPNLGGGELGAAALYPPVGTYPPGDLVVANFDGDAGESLDVVAADWVEDHLEIRLNQGDGTLAALPLAATCATPSKLAAGDVDADGDVDLVVICTGGADSVAQVMLNDGLAGFTAAGGYPAGLNPMSPLLVDLDGDLDLDLALAHDTLANPDSLSLLSVQRNDGAGGFGAAEEWPTGSSPRALAAVDLDADGDLDLVSADSVGDSLSVHLNDGAGGFSRAVSVEAGVRPVGLAALDLDGEGGLDLVSLEDPNPDPNGGLTRLMRTAPREADLDGDGVPDACGEPVSLTALPDHGGDIGRVSLLLRGGSFAPGAAVELRRAGAATRTADHLALGADGRAAQATFDLTGAALGTWDLAVVGPGGTLQLCPGCFTVVAGVPPDLRVSISGRSNVRVGRDQLYQLEVVNQGNVDAESVLLWLTVPSGVQFIPDTPLERPWPPGAEPGGYTEAEVPLSFEVEGGVRVPILKPVLPPARPWRFSYRLRADEGGEHTVSASGFVLRPGDPVAAGQCRDTMVEKMGDAIRDAVADAAVPSGCLSALGGLVSDSLGTIEDYARDEMDATDAAFNGADLGLGLASGVVSCAGLLGTVIPHAKAIAIGLNAIQLFATLSELTYACGGGSLLGNMFNVFQALLAVLAMDPNEISGPGGAGPERDLRGDAPFAYTVTFENLATASAPAQEVRVRVPFPAGLDPASLALGPVGFGERFVSPAPGRASFSTRVDLRPAQDLLVELEAGYDPAAGEIAWTLRSLDPATLAPPDDPLAGFLPPNTDHPAGEGYVTFEARALPGLATGDRIAAAAEIVFDLNAPIATNTWSNRIDLAPPATSLAPLPAESPAGFEVAWTVQDQGAGLADTTVLVAVDGGPEEVWLFLSPARAAAFEGEPGRCYAFRARSLDRAGNEEAAPSPAVETCCAAEGDPGDEDSGCLCGGAGRGGWLWLLLLAGWALNRRRRVRRARPRAGAGAAPG